MPRSARVVLPNYPHHIVQRGHNRHAVFADDEDYQYYLCNLREWKENLGCKVYAYCLMTNHVHLVIDPGDEEGNLGMIMKRISGRQTRYVNKLEGRSGTLWNGRFKSSPIDTDDYLLACCRYIDLNPVRAGMVKVPGQYRWSSFRAKAGLEIQEWLDFDPMYRGLGRDREERRDRYRTWVKKTVPEGEWELLRQAVQRGQLTGSARFADEIAANAGTRVEERGRGRPGKQK
jgi:putative transposase